MGQVLAIQPEVLVNINYIIVRVNQKEEMAVETTIVLLVVTQIYNSFNKCLHSIKQAKHNNNKDLGFKAEWQKHLVQEEAGVRAMAGGRIKVGRILGEEATNLFVYNQYLINYGLKKGLF